MKNFTMYFLGLFLIGTMLLQPVSAQEADVSSGEELQIFPNPTSGDFQLTLEYKGREKVTAKVYDFTGKVIEDVSDELVREESSITARVKLNDPGTGIYFLRVQMGSKLITKKIIVK